MTADAADQRIRNGDFGHKVLCGKKRLSTTAFSVGSDQLCLPGEEAIWCDDHGFIISEVAQECYKGDWLQSPATIVEFDHVGKFVPPPRYVALSDELVYHIIKFISQKERYASWPADFDGSGNIQADPCPQDPAPIGRLHGLTSAPVYCRYYALVGNRVASVNGYMIAPKVEIKEAASDFAWGLVILHDTFVLNQPVALNRQIYSHSGKIFDEPIGSELACLKRKAKADDKAEHTRLLDTAVGDHRACALYFIPTGPYLAPLWHFHGYHIACSPDTHKQPSSMIIAS
ncbi:uncharacterized protein N7503_001574 [Penicillium pulvis]|uniref:uncharacterized protein n=1 Tax=Penicillium pulvis TaxID=1562058 RepID=UPI002546994D|nr:uncharacterized protein N7503_001574 [Penicillium pulvis]KAJ5809356.1 hypothetical protein N7503_001574 [Penicillium pulvis]